MSEIGKTNIINFLIQKLWINKYYEKRYTYYTKKLASIRTPNKTDKQTRKHPPSRPQLKKHTADTTSLENTYKLQMK